MKEIRKKWNEWKEKEKVRKWFTRDNLLILILSGVLLMIIAAPSGKKNQGEDSSSSDLDKAGSLFDGDFWGGTGAEKESEQEETFARERQGEAVWEGNFAAESYAEYLENRLTALLESMDGVGRVSVMITLCSSEEVVLEKDRETLQSGTSEEDGEGGSRSIRETENRETTVYDTSGDGQSPYVVKTLTPQVEGVVVAAQGAGTKRVAADITEAVQALFGIEAHKVKVLRRKTGE